MAGIDHYESCPSAEVSREYASHSYALISGAVDIWGLMEVNLCRD